MAPDSEHGPDHGQEYIPDLDPVNNPEVQETLSRHYSNAAVMILPLSSGRFAIIDRGYNIHAIVDAGELPTPDEFRALSLGFEKRLKLAATYAEAARFYGEPDDKSLARDIKRAHTAPSVRKSRTDLAVDIEL